MKIIEQANTFRWQYILTPGMTLADNDTIYNNTEGRIAQEVDPVCTAVMGEMKDQC